MRTPAMWSFGSCTPPFAQSLRLPRALGGDEEQVADDRRIALRRDARYVADAITGLAGSLTSQIVKPAKLPWRRSGRRTPGRS